MPTFKIGALLPLNPVLPPRPAMYLRGLWLSIPNRYVQMVGQLHSPASVLFFAGSVWKPFTRLLRRETLVMGV